MGQGKKLFSAAMLTASLGAFAAQAQTGVNANAQAACVGSGTVMSSDSQTVQPASVSSLDSAGYGPDFDGFVGGA